jgi:hypothetical protein
LARFLCKLGEVSRTESELSWVIQKFKTKTCLDLPDLSATVNAKSFLKIIKIKNKQKPRETHPRVHFGTGVVLKLVPFSDSPMTTKRGTLEK